MTTPPRTMLFNHDEFDHESVTFAHDPDTGLKAIIAVHNRRRGPAIGGCRMMAYPDEISALTDVLRLSKGMTYKCAIGDIPFGGGKAVIMGDPATQKTLELLRAMGTFVEQLGGRYITSFDSGTTIDDIAVIGETTRHVGGIKPGAGNASASTAYGVLVCMREAVRIRLGAETLSGLVVAIQGAGNVGSRLAKLVAEDGGRVVIADINQDLALSVAESTGAASVRADEILSMDCDVLAPCALGAVFSADSVNQLTCPVICGGANNQLADNSVADELMERQVFYCPDYLANAGGIIDLHYQLNKPSRDALKAHLDRLAETLQDCHAIAAEHRCSMASAADLIAEARFQ